MSESSRGTLVFHHNGIGDYVMSIPALRLLACAAPRPLHLVCGDVPASLLYHEIEVDQFSTVPVSPGLFAHWVDIGSVSLPRSYEFFVSLATWDSLELTTLAQKAGAKATVGLFSYCSLRLMDQPEHDIARLFTLALPFAPSARLQDYAQPLRFPNGTERLRASILCGARLLLVVHGDTRIEKVWPRDRYDEVLTSFVRSAPDWRVAALNFRPDELSSALATGRVSALLNVELSVAMCLVADADMFLGIDSCMLHVADLCRVPGVALFGPTRPEQFGYHLTSRLLTQNLLSSGGLAFLSAAEVTEALHTIRERIQDCDLAIRH